MSIWDTVAAPIIAIINKVVPDKAAAAAAVASLQTMQLQGQLNEELMQLTSVTSAQSDINKVEAASNSTFVAGWRPMIGWVCASALAYQYLLKPAIMAGFSIARQIVPVMPGIDDQLWQLMFGLLGMGTLRTVEKIRGVASNGISK